MASTHPDAPAVRLVTVGLMGSGKSTVGKRVAHRLGWPYYDNDDLLSEATGRSLADFTAAGGEALHEAEAAVIRDVMDRPPPFVAGAAAAVVEDPATVDALRDAAFGVYLHVSPARLVERIGSDAHRPWLKPDPLAALTRMYDARDADYRRAAAVVVEADAEPDAVAAEVLRALTAAP